LKATVGSHAHDKRIFLWDLCNEPFNSVHSAEVKNIYLKWLNYPQKCVKTTFLTRKPLKILDIIL